MTTIAVDTRTFRLRLPVLRLGSVRTSVVVCVTEQVELHVERRHARPRRAPAPARVTAAHAEQRLDAARTAALAARLPGF